MMDAQSTVRRIVAVPAIGTGPRPSAGTVPVYSYTELNGTGSVSLNCVEEERRREGGKAVQLIFDWRFSIADFAVVTRK